MPYKRARQGSRVFASLSILPIVLRRKLVDHAAHGIPVASEIIQPLGKDLEIHFAVALVDLERCKQRTEVRIHSQELVAKGIQRPNE